MLPPLLAHVKTQCDAHYVTAAANGHGKTTSACMRGQTFGCAASGNHVWVGEGCEARFLCSVGFATQLCRRNITSNRSRSSLDCTCRLRAGYPHNPPTTAVPSPMCSDSRTARGDTDDDGVPETEPPATASRESTFHMALAFSGGLGLFDGKLRDSVTAPRDGLFNISVECWRRTLLATSVAALLPSQHVTTFLHSWHTTLQIETRMVAALQPAAYVFEAPLPGSNPNISCPVQDYAFRSMWNSRLGVLRLVRSHEEGSTGRRFNAVMLARLDLCPCQGAPIDAARSFHLPDAAVLRLGLFGWHKRLALPPRHCPCGNTTGLGGSCCKLFAELRADDRVLLGRSGALQLIAQRLADGVVHQCDPHALLAQAVLQSIPWRELQVSVAGIAGEKETLSETRYVPASIGLVRDSWPLVSCNSLRLTAKPHLCFNTFCACEKAGFMPIVRREGRRPAS